MRLPLAALAAVAAVSLARPALAEPGERARRVVAVTSSVTVLEDVPFAEGYTGIPPRLAPMLDAVAETLRGNPDLRLIEIQGAADDLPSPRHNVALALGRALAVRSYLIARGVEHWRLRVATATADAHTSRGVEFVIAARR